TYYTETMEQTVEVRVLERTYWLILTFVLTVICSLAADYRAESLYLFIGLVPLLLVSSRFEKIVFDGAVIARRGPFAFLEWLVSGRRQELPLDMIEMITSEAIRSRRGFNQVKYLYKITVAGSGIQIIISWPTV